MKVKSVDVIIPTYKRASFLTRAIESVLSQSYKAVNIIVVDDNDSDDRYRKDTEQLMLEYEENKRVTYLKHDRNKNGAAARNTGIQSSSADYIAFLDDDDFYLENKIQSQVDIMNKSDESWGGCTCFHVRRYRKYAFKKVSVIENASGNYCYDFLSGRTSTPSSTLLLRTEVFTEIGLFDETFKRHQDLEFLVRFYQKYKMAVSKNFDLYMQVDGFRNYPKSNVAFDVKNKFLKKYEMEIRCFSLTEQKEIFKSQWFEVAVLFLKDREITKAKALFKRYIFVKGLIRSADYIRVVFFLLIGYFPSIRTIVSIILGMTLYREFSGEKVVLKNSKDGIE